MFSRPKILFLVSLLFVALLNPKFNPYLPFKFLIFYHSSVYIQSLMLSQPYTKIPYLEIVGYVETLLIFVESDMQLTLDISWIMVMYTMMMPVGK